MWFPDSLYGLEGRSTERGSFAGRAAAAPLSCDPVQGPPTCGNSLQGREDCPPLGTPVLLGLVPPRSWQPAGSSTACK